MKAAIVLEAVFPENKGGLERWYSYLSQELAKKVTSIDYLNSSNVNRVEGNLSYISVTDQQWSYLEGGVRSINQALKFSWALAKWFSINKYDFIYLSSVPILSIFVVPIIRIRNPKTVVVVEWLEYWPYKYWCAYKGKFIGGISWFIQLAALQIGDYRTTFIRRTQLRIKSRNLTWAKKNTLLLPGLVNDKFISEKTQENERNDITFLGRLVDEKQPILAIKIIEQYILSGWTGTFWLIGTGPEESNIKLAIEESGKQNQIKLIVNASDEEIREKFKNSFLLFHPSKREGYGLVCVEAAFTGLPTLLINYPENGAVDLQINPRLISKSHEAKEILCLIEYAKNNFKEESAQAIDWASDSLIFQTKRKSVEKILELARSNA